MWLNSVWILVRNLNRCTPSPQREDSIYNLTMVSLFNIWFPLMSYICDDTGSNTINIDLYRLQTCPIFRLFTIYFYPARLHFQVNS